MLDTPPRLRKYRALPCGARPGRFAVSASTIRGEFRDHKIEAELLPRLTADDLKDIGVSAVGDRRRLFDAAVRWLTQSPLRMSRLRRQNLRRPHAQTPNGARSR